MPPSGTSSDQPLRERAEALATSIPGDLERMSSDEIQRLIHELQVHQIELELQNEELRETQLKLAASRDRYTDLYEFAPVGYLTLDSEMRIVAGNLTATTMLGIERSELLGKSFSHIVVPECADLLHGYMRALQEDASKYTCELQLRRGKRASFPAQLEFARASGSIDESASFRCIIVDITERKQAEDEVRLLNAGLEEKVTERTSELKEREAALLEFFRSAPIGLLWSDPSGRILRVNWSLLDKLRLPEAQVIGRMICDFDTTGGFEEMVHALKAGGTVDDQHVRLRCGDGSILDALIDAVAIREGGRIVRLDWFIRDVSLRVELEQRALNAGELERQEIGNELHDDLGQVLHGVHYLASELKGRMDQKNMPEGVELEKLIVALNEAMATVRSLARGLLPVPAVPEGLQRALNEHAASVRKLYGVDCRFICPEPIKVGDPKVATHLFRIAQEAVTNAVKHSKCDQISVWLKEEEGRGRLILGVRDNGSGIVKSRQSGNGVGLRAMQYRSRAINGSLIVQHMQEGGTEIVCSLKLPASTTSHPFNQEFRE